MGKILVIGSSNTDLIATVKSFPSAGETIIGTSFLQAMGGKGANQAVAAHKLGGDVKFITCLGSDTNGQNTLKYFKEEGLDVSASLIVDGVPSGTAIILVDENGENCIVITPGANEMITSDYIFEVEEEIKRSDLVILQMEIPYKTVKTVCELAHKNHKRVMINVAPACQLDEEIIKQIDILVVNEIEAETISGEKIKSIGKEAVSDRLISMGFNTVVLTLGTNGCFMKDNKNVLFVPAFVVETMDTTAAGDTFCGALAVGLSKNHEWADALKFATAASAICVTRMGAQPSIPTAEEVIEFLAKYN
jgi:ribokinase